MESNIQEVLIKTTKETTKSIDSNTNKEEDNNMVDMDVMIPDPIREPEETITYKEGPNTSDTTMPDDINQQQLQKQHERGQLQFKTTKKDWVIDPKKRKLIDIGSVARGIVAKTKMTTKSTFPTTRFEFLEKSGLFTCKTFGRTEHWLKIEEGCVVLKKGFKTTHESVPYYDTKDNAKRALQLDMLIRMCYHWDKKLDATQDPLWTHRYLRKNEIRSTLVELTERDIVGVMWFDPNNKRVLSVPTSDDLNGEWQDFVLQSFHSTNHQS